MASLQDRNGIYYIVFSKRVDGKLHQKKYSLRTRRKAKAEKLKAEYEELHFEGEIDPFGDWHPQTHQQKKREEKPGITLEELSEVFVKNRSQANAVTKKNSPRHLNMLMDLVGKTMPVTLIMEEDIREFCFQDHLANATKRSYLRHCKVFFNWLKQKEYVEKDVTAHIVPPKKETNISEKTIREPELEKVFTKYREDMRKKKAKGYIQTCSQSRVWFRPVVMSAFYAGLRLREVVSLRWEHVNFSQRQMTITGTKSGDERAIPIRKKLRKTLKAWHRYQQKPSKGLVFPSVKSSKDRQVKMGKGNISKVFKKYVRQAGLKESITFHGLRHSCATELLRMGFDINEVSKMLGHSSLEVTRLYEHLTNTDLADKMQRLENEEQG